MSTVRLQGNDGKDPFDVDIKVACYSELIKTMLNTLGHTEEDQSDVIPFPNVSDAILRKVMEWAEHHKDDPEPPNDDENIERHTEDISAWDAQYVEVDQGTLHELLMAANYLKVRGLLSLTCRAVANKIKGKIPLELRQMFKLKKSSEEAANAQGE